MSKSFRAILSEQDAEHVYHIKSTRHLHDDEIYYKLQIGMLGYDLRSLEKVSYNPLAAREPMFRPYNDPDGTDYVYHVKVVLGTDVPNEVLRQKVAYFTDIHWKWIVVHRDGEKMEDAEDVEVEEGGGTYNTLAQNAKNWTGTPDEGDIDTEVSALAGQGRIDAFMKELDDDRKEREQVIKASNTQPKLHEAFVTSQLGLSDVMGHTPRKGYYLVERFKLDPSILHIDGPFQDKPVTHEFIPNLLIKGAGRFEILNEERVKLVDHDRDFRYTRPLREKQIRNYEVKVKDQDTGRTYSALVKAFTETDARTKAVNRVAQKEKLDAGRLIAVEPEVA